MGPPPGGPPASLLAKPAPSLAGLASGASSASTSSRSLSREPDGSERPLLDQGTLITNPEGGGIYRIDDLVGEGR